MKREATISACGSYRFDLTRTIEPGCACKRCNGSLYSQSILICAKMGALFPYVLWVMCNPSRADALDDDPTERRCWGFTDKWGYHEMRIVNVNPYRSSSPFFMHQPDVSTLLLNEATIKRHAHEAALIVCAWGLHADRMLARRAEESLRLVAPQGTLFTLGLTKNGTPKHPLYLNRESQPKIWN